jgi:serine/threonine protein kinase
MVNKEYKLISFLPNDLVLDKYRIKSKIGDGGMNSSVYLAEDIQVNDNEYFAIKNKLVAIKVINRNASIEDND